MLTFIIGLLVGGLVGVFTMCLFQINKSRGRFAKKRRNGLFLLHRGLRKEPNEQFYVMGRR